MRGSRRPRMWARALRLGSMDLLYASGEERSRFQCRSRRAVDCSISFRRNLSMPSIMREAMSSVQVRGWVLGRGSAREIEAKRSRLARGRRRFMWAPCGNEVPGKLRIGMGRTTTYAVYCISFHTSGMRGWWMSFSLRSRLVFAATLLVASLVVRADEAVDFERDVRPVLQTSCVECHGAEKQKGGLRLGVRALSFEGGNGG